MAVQRSHVPPKRSAPLSKKILFRELEEIVRHGEYVMPGNYAGTGAPGVYLEDLLGLRAGNKDIPDSLGWELKFYTPSTNLVTLFHKEPQPKDIIAYMVKTYGWKDKDGRMSFRHTISGKSDRFQVDARADQIFIRRIGLKGRVPYWTRDDILSAAGAKLRRLVLVRGLRKGQAVTYDHVDIYENLQLTFFLGEVCNGTVKVDFDAREMRPGSSALRNHGTKFRVSPNDICRLYARKERLC